MARTYGGVAGSKENQEYHLWKRLRAAGKTKLSFYRWYRKEHPKKRRKAVPKRD